MCALNFKTTTTNSYYQHHYKLATRKSILFLLFISQLLLLLLYETYYELLKGWTEFHQQIYALENVVYVKDLSQNNRAAKRTEQLTTKLLGTLLLLIIIENVFVLYLR